MNITKAGEARLLGQGGGALAGIGAAGVESGTPGVGLLPVVVAGYESPRHVYLASAGWGWMVALLASAVWRSGPTRLWRPVTVVLVAALLGLYGTQVLADVRLWNTRARVSEAAVRDLDRGGIRGAKQLGALMTLSARLVDEASSEVEVAFPDGRRLRTGDEGLDAAIATHVGRSVRMESLRPADDLDHYQIGRAHV